MFSPIFVLPGEIFAHRVCLLAVGGYPGIYEHRFFALWSNASTQGAGGIRQLTGGCSSLTGKTKESADPVSQTETLGCCEKSGLMSPSGIPIPSWVPSRGKMMLSPLFFPAYQREFGGQRTSSNKKSEQGGLPVPCSLWCAPRCCLKTGFLGKGGRAAGGATSMETLGAKGWKSQSHLLWLVVLAKGMRLSPGSPIPSWPLLPSLQGWMLRAGAQRCLTSCVRSPGDARALALDS